MTKKQIHAEKEFDIIEAIANYILRLESQFNCEIKFNIDEIDFK